MAKEHLPAPEIVGTCFVEKYYWILCQAPDQLHRFYEDSSYLSRRGADGAMITVTTKQGIHEMFLSLDKVYGVDILTIDSQYADHKGYLVFVTGFLRGMHTIRKFTQTFFLTPQATGFYVLNDIFRYVDDHASTIIIKYEHEPKLAADNSTNEEAHAADPVQAAETTQVVDRSAENLTSPPEKIVSNIDETNHQLENGETVIAERVVQIAEKEVEITEKEVEIVVPKSDSTPKDVVPVDEKAAPVAKQDAEKMTYASLVNALKENPQPFKEKPKVPKPLLPVPTLPAPAKAPAPAPAKAPAPAPAAAAAPAPGSKKPEKINYRAANAVKGHSVFIRNLPYNATAELVESIFLKFGSIKPRGVQVRSFKDRQSCFGFVEFVSLSSMERAIKASPIAHRNWHIEVQMKRQDNNNAGRSQNGNVQPRGGFEGQGNESRANGGGNNYNARSSSNGNGNSYSRDQGVYQNGGAAPQTAQAQRN